MDPMEPMKIEVSSDPCLDRREAMDPTELMKLDVSSTFLLSMDEPLKPRSVGVVALLAVGGSSAASDWHEAAAAASLVPPELPPGLSPLPSGSTFMPAWEPFGVAGVLPQGMSDFVHPHLAPFYGEHEGETYAGHRAQLALSTAQSQITWGGGMEHIKEEPKAEALCGKPYSYLASGESASASLVYINFSTRGAVAEADNVNKQVKGKNGSKRFNKGKGIYKPSLMDFVKQVQESGGLLSGPELMKAYELSTCSIAVYGEYESEACAGHGAQLSLATAQSHVTSWDACGIGRNWEEPEPLFSKPYPPDASGESASAPPSDYSSSTRGAVAEVDTENEQVEGENGSRWFNKRKGIRNPSLTDFAKQVQEAGGLLSGPELLKCYERSTCSSTGHGDYESEVCAGGHDAQISCATTESRPISWNACSIGSDQEEPEPSLSKPYSNVASGESATVSPPDNNSFPHDTITEADTENEQVEGEDRSSMFHKCIPFRNHSVMARARRVQGASGLLSSPELQKCIAESAARFCVDCGITVHPEGRFCHDCGARICGR